MSVVMYVMSCEMSCYFEWFLSLYAIVILSFFFFSKQTTAYELRIRDWSSDVCSSDLRPGRPRDPDPADRDAGRARSLGDQPRTAAAQPADLPAVRGVHRRGHGHDGGQRLGRRRAGPLPRVPAAAVRPASRGYRKSVG